MIGFNAIITFDNMGNISDYQKAYNNCYAKKVKIYLPMKYITEESQKAVLNMAVNNTFPLVIEESLGVKSKTDVNCFEFDVSVLYKKYHEDLKIGLSKFILYSQNGNIEYTSQTFRV